MGRKRRNSAEALLEELRSEQSINSQHESQARDVETPTPPSNNGNTIPSLSAIETLPQAKEDPLLVKIIGIRKMLLFILMYNYLSLLSNWLILLVLHMDRHYY